MLWKFITAIVFILLLIFGYMAIKSKATVPTSADSAISTGEELSRKYTGSMWSLLGDTALLPTNLEDNVPIVDESDLGELSPLYGKVIITKDPWGPETEDVQAEYVELKALETNTSAINITGWSLQSMVSGVRIYIQDGVEDIIMNDVNPTYKIGLAPGQSAIVSSSPSPVGVSFQSNLCTGYFNQFQKYEPPLTRSCPSPAQVLPPTVANIATYGSECLELASSLFRCEYLTDEILEEEDISVSSACTEHLRTTLTYTSCRAAYHNSPEYLKGSQWRIFLGAQAPLWNKQYEVIRLLDELGRTVDVYAY